jgi:hypothetical protein
MTADVRSSFPTEREAANAVAGILGIEHPDLVRKWMRDPRLSGNSSKLQALKRFAFRSHTIVIGVVITVLGGLGLAYSQQVFGVGQASAPAASPAAATAPPTAPQTAADPHSATVPRRPQLEVDQVSLTSQGLQNITLPDGDGEAQPSPFLIDIRLLNNGNAAAAINSARLVFQQTVVLPTCASQGGFEPTGTYSANMPIDPAPGSSVTIPVSQIVLGGQGDRFDLKMRADWGNASEYNYVYRFRLSLSYNNGEQLNLGYMTTDFPMPPLEGINFWSRQLAAEPRQFLNYAGPRAEACDIAGSKALRSILSQPGTQSAGLSGLLAQLAY